MALFRPILIASLLATALGLAAPSSVKNIPIHFNAFFDGKPLVFEDSTYHSNNGDSIQITNLKFYISNINLTQNNAIVWTESNSYHLVDLQQLATTNWKLTVPEKLKFNDIQFYLGIDSATHAKGALGGDLDPTRGMYWTWQNGYINCKIEGQSNRCNTRNHAFVFHLGGYMHPYNCLQKIQLQVSNTNTINLGLNLSDFIKQIDLQQQNTLMSPGTQAVDLAKLFSQTFYSY